MPGKYLPAPVLAPFLTQEEAEIFGVPPANLQIFTPRLVNPSWLVSLRVPCLSRLSKTVFGVLESLTIDSLTDPCVLGTFSFPALRKFAASLVQGCVAVPGTLEFLRASPALTSCDLSHAKSNEPATFEVPKNFRHFGVVGCVACSLNCDLTHLKSVGVSVSTKFPTKFPTISESVENLHLDFRMVWRPSLEIISRKLPTLTELTVSGPVFGDSARVLGRLLSDSEKFPTLKRLRLAFLNTRGSPLLGLLQETTARISVEDVSQY